MFLSYCFCHFACAGRGGDVRVVTQQLDLIQLLAVDVFGGDGGGAAGAVEYLVHTGGASFRANDPYRLVLSGLGVSSSLADGVIQPGDTIQFADVGLKNAGSLPFPGTAIFRFSASSGSFSVVSPLEPFSIPMLLPGQEYRLPFPVVINVANITPRQRAGMERAQGYATSGSLDLYATILGRHTFAQKFEAQIEWPVTMRNVTIPRDCSLGTNFKFKICLDNISTKPFIMERQDGIRLRVWLDRSTTLF